MRIAPFAIISSMAALLACGSVPNVQTTDSGSGTDTDTSSGTGTESTGQNPTTSNGSGGVCVPGTSIACTCTNGAQGAQVCNAQGSGYDECECEGGSNSESDSNPTTDPGTSTSSTSTTDPGTSTDPDTTTDPGTSTDGTTTETGTTDPGTSTTTGGLMCEDPGEEPNEDEPSAVDLGDQGCGDQPETFSGMLAGPNDVDWFTWRGDWNGFCSDIFDQQPEGEHTLTASADIRLCVFVECVNGNEDIDCEGDATMSDSPEGRPGCCNNGSVSFSNFNCTMAEEDAQIYVRLDQAPDDTCVDYEVEYDFNN